jgi:uncharacterized protein (TIRG00374 family)
LAVLVARSLGIDTPIYILVAAFTVTGIVSLIPIAPAGLGTRDAALMWLLSGYGVEAHQAIALSFIMFVCLILSNMLGMTYFLSNKRANLFNEGYTKIT